MSLGDLSCTVKAGMCAGDERSKAGELIIWLASVQLQYALIWDECVQESAGVQLSGVRLPCGWRCK